MSIGYHWNKKNPEQKRNFDNLDYYLLLLSRMFMLLFYERCFSKEIELFELLIYEHNLSEHFRVRIWLLLIGSRVQ